MRAGRILAWSAAGFALAAGLWMTVQTDGSSVGARPHGSSPEPTSTASNAPDAQREVAAPTVAPTVIPKAPQLGADSGLSPQELTDLRAELANHPYGEAEVQRVLGFLRFSRQWEAFNAARRQGEDSAALRALAVTLDAQLAQHWLQGALTGGQALQLKTQLLDVLLPDEPSRSLALAHWQSQIWPARATTAAPATQLAQQKGVAR
jgi:hypothetical protein